MLSRFGGDEFALLLPSTDSRQAAHVVRRIRDKEKNLTLACIDNSGRKMRIPIRISIGAAGSDEVAPENVLSLADDRMYTDKKQYYRQLTIERDALDSTSAVNP